VTVGYNSSFFHVKHIELKRPSHTNSPSYPSQKIIRRECVIKLLMVDGKDYHAKSVVTCPFCKTDFPKMQYANSRSETFSSSPETIQNKCSGRNAKENYYTFLIHKYAKLSVFGPLSERVVAMLKKRININPNENVTLFAYALEVTQLEQKMQMFERDTSLPFSPLEFLELPTGCPLLINKQ